MKTISLSNVEAKAIHFESPFDPKHRYIVLAEDMDFLAFMKKYCVGDMDAKKATGVEMGNGNDDWYMVYVENCFDPPIAIVNAENEQDAEEAFVEALPWSHITEPDLKDYDPETLHYGPSGQPYDAEQVMVRQIKLVLIEC
jgi:hypothetical protein